MSAQRIGVLGGGKTNRKNAVALLKDFVNNRGVEIFVVAAPFDDAGRYAADWALMNQIPTTIFTGVDSTEDFTDYEDATFLEREEPIEALRTVLSRGEGSALLYAFADTEEEEDLLKGFLTAGVEVFDFAEGLYPVTLEDDGEPETPTAEVTVDEETVEDRDTTVTTLADDDMGLEPEQDVLEATDEAQQVTEPEPTTKKPRASRKTKVTETPVEETTTDAFTKRLFGDHVPSLGNNVDERFLNSPQIQELIELGRAVKTLLDYLAKAGDSGKTVNVQVV